MMTLYFTGKDDGPTIDEFIQRYKSTYGTYWKLPTLFNMRDEAQKWNSSLEYQQLIKLSDAEFEKIFLDKWSRARKRRMRHIRG